MVALCGTMFAIAIGLERRGARHVIDASDRTARVELLLQRAVAANQYVRAELGPFGAIPGEYLDDAARGVAVQHRERTTQHFDALRGREVEGGGLALSDGIGIRQSVHHQADARHAKRRTRAEATQGKLQVLCETLPAL